MAQSPSRPRSRMPTASATQLPAGVLPADGQRHALVVPLPGPRQASYPLRLLSLSLTYVLPPYDPASPLAAPTASLSIFSLAVAGTASGPFGRPFSHGAALAAWQAAGSSPRVPTGPPGVFETFPPSDGVRPDDPGLARRRRGKPATHVQYRARSVGIDHEQRAPRSAEPSPGRSRSRRSRRPGSSRPSPPAVTWRPAGCIPDRPSRSRSADPRSRSGSWPRWPGSRPCSGGTGR